MVTIQRRTISSLENGISCVLTTQSSYEPTSIVAVCISDMEDVSFSSDCYQEASTYKQSNKGECYYAVKGATLVLPQNECMKTLRHGSLNSGDIQQHLQSMFCLLRPEDTLKMAVKLESIHKSRTRYLVIVSTVGHQDCEEYCLLGVDCNLTATIGLVLRVLADMTITLDGDGGFSVTSGHRTHIFKPVSVQAMWSALQSLHKASQKAREFNHFLGGLTHHWVNHYEDRIRSERSCLNEWHAMDDLVNKRPPSPDTRSKPTEKEKTEKMICSKLKEIMMSVDLDEVTSKYIRTRLEEESDTNLKEYKSFIDQEMIRILGQMDAASEIFDYLFLGSEWNASNLEELQKNKIGHILNVTREIDNFFPGMFDYSNIRVYDDEATELLKHWDKTFKYIKKAKEKGSKVLVHCKMGISRSASVVMAYAMKAYNWNLSTALEFVKNKRGCINPNSSFMKQLEIYEGILDASKHRHNKLWRSKSETSLKSPVISISNNDSVIEDEDTMMQSHEDENSSLHLDLSTPGKELITRPKSWSPEESLSDMLFPDSPSEDNCDEPNYKKTRPHSYVEGTSEKNVDKSVNLSILVPCSNGHTYNVSQNKVFNLYCPSSSENHSIFELEMGSELNSALYECYNPIYSPNVGLPSPPKVSSVKDRIDELKSHVSKPLVKDKRDLPDRKGLVLNLANQFETVSKSESPTEEGNSDMLSSDSNPSVPACVTPVHMGDFIIDDKNDAFNTLKLTKKTTKEPEGNDVIYTPGIVKRQTKDLEEKLKLSGNTETSSKTCKTPTQQHKTIDRIEPCSGSLDDNKVNSKTSDPFSSRLDKVFDREERKQNQLSAIETKKIPPLCELNELITESKDFLSRQSSFSSCDSAVVLSVASDRESPSRQSSWGSCDTRLTQDNLLSRNSSLGSYDLKSCAASHDIKSCPVSRVQSFNDQCHDTGLFMIDNDCKESSGTVKRAKSKLEDPVPTHLENDQTKHSVAKIQVHCPRPFRVSSDKSPSNCEADVSSCSALSGSNYQLFPHASSSALCHKMMDCESSKIPISNPPISTSSYPSSEMEDIYNVLLDSESQQFNNCNSWKPGICDRMKMHSLTKENPELHDPGVVKRITKALEKKNSNGEKPLEKGSAEETTFIFQRCHSLDKVESCRYPSSSSSSTNSLSEEPCVKLLVGKFEPSKEALQKEDPWKKQNPPIPLRKSSLDLQTLKNMKSNSVTKLSASAPGKLTSLSFFLAKPETNLEKTAVSDEEIMGKMKPPSSGKPTLLDSKLHIGKNLRHYGKTHPLTKLASKQRHPNNLYNTM